ncbi:MAG: hypothetical protein WCT04_22995 [Planctomycetota bacterium]
MRTRLLVLLILGILSASVYASSAGKISRDGVEPAAEASQYTHKLLTEIPWSTSLEAAQAKAKKENKLVFWMHMLGKLDGIT